MLPRTVGAASSALFHTDAHAGVHRIAGFKLLYATCALLLLSASAAAQSTTGRILGTLTDQSGAAVAGATVVVTDVQRGTSRTLTTDESGAYAAPDRSFGAILPFGIGFLAVDGPGTGQAPIKVSETSERMLSKVIDYAQSRPEIDKNRIALHGVSWGAYWATKMAIVERTRLRGASAQSPPVDKFFQKDFLMNHLLGNREYLFDQVPALMNILEGVHSLNEMGEYLPKISLVHQGLLGKPMAPMLILAGVLDTQVPIEDEYLLLSNGDVPKDAWINPHGGQSRPAGRSVARSADLQAGHHSLACKNAGAAGKLATACSNAHVEKVASAILPGPKPGGSMRTCVHRSAACPPFSHRPSHCII